VTRWLLVLLLWLRAQVAVVLLAGVGTCSGPGVPFRVHDREPRWLAQKGQFSAAEKALESLQGSTPASWGSKRWPTSSSRPAAPRQQTCRSRSYFRSSTGSVSALYTTDEGKPPLSRRSLDWHRESDKKGYYAQGMLPSVRVERLAVCCADVGVSTAARQ